MQFKIPSLEMMKFKEIVAPLPCSFLGEGAIFDSIIGNYDLGYDVRRFEDGEFNVVVGDKKIIFNKFRVFSGIGYADGCKTKLVLTHIGFVLIYDITIIVTVYGKSSYVNIQYMISKKDWNIMRMTIRLPEMLGHPKIYDKNMRRNNGKEHRNVVYDEIIKKVFKDKCCSPERVKVEIMNLVGIIEHCQTQIGLKKL